MPWRTFERGLLFVLVLSGAMQVNQFLSDVLRGLFCRKFTAVVAGKYSKGLLYILCVAAVIVFSAGCVGHTQVISTPGHAYVVDGSLFGTDLYYCGIEDNGEPVCDQVKERAQ